MTDAANPPSLGHAGLSQNADIEQDSMARRQTRPESHSLPPNLNAKKALRVFCMMDGVRIVAWLVVGLGLSLELLLRYVHLDQDGPMVVYLFAFYVFSIWNVFVFNALVQTVRLRCLLLVAGVCLSYTIALLAIRSAQPSQPTPPRPIFEAPNLGLCRYIGDEVPVYVEFCFYLCFYFKI